MSLQWQTRKQVERGWGTCLKSLSPKEVAFAPRTPCLSCALNPYFRQKASDRMDNCAVGAGTGGRTEKTELGEPIWGHLTEQVTSLRSGDYGAANQDEAEGGVVPEAGKDGAWGWKKGLAQSSCLTAVWPWPSSLPFRSSIFSSVKWGEQGRRMKLGGEYKAFSPVTPTWWELLSVGFMVTNKDGFFVVAPPLKASPSTVTPCESGEKSGVVGVAQMASPSVYQRKQSK